MKTGAAGLALIKSFEGLRLAAYDDGAGVWTVGYGHTHGVRRGQIITETRADELLRDDLATAEAAVTDAVHVPLGQNQFDALVVFVFNIGAPAFTASTLLQRLNAGQYEGVPLDLAKWVHAGGKVMTGLARRRAAEGALWCRPEASGEAVPPRAAATTFETRLGALEARLAAVEASLASTASAPP